MKKDKAIYWTTTGIIAALMVTSAYYFAFSVEQKAGFQHLGLPNWFRLELTVAKALGAVALVVPSVPRKVKEFAYFGFGLVFVSADIAHLSSGDTPWLVVPHWTLLGVLIVSYVYYDRLAKAGALYPSADQRGGVSCPRPVATPT